MGMYKYKCKYVYAGLLNFCLPESGENFPIMNCKFVSLLSFFLQNCNEFYDRNLPAQPWSSQYEVNIFPQVINILRLSVSISLFPMQASSISGIERFSKVVMIRPVSARSQHFYLITDILQDLTVSKSSPLKASLKPCQTKIYLEKQKKASKENQFHL